MRKNNLFISFFLGCCVLNSCNPTKLSNTVGIPYYPATILNRIIDTTYQYNVYNGKNGYIGGNIYLTMPDSLGGKEVNGFVDLYSLIDERKQITEIKILSSVLTNNGKYILTFDSQKDKEPLDNPYFLKLKKYLNSIIESIPFKQNVEASTGVHYTYCSINFSK